MSKAVDRKIIYLPIMGRIGNQLFQYAFAYSLMKEYGCEAQIIVDESEVVNGGWINSLRDYSLENTIFVSGRDAELNSVIAKGRRAYKFYRKFLYSEDSLSLQRRERCFQGVLNHFGLIAILRGYGQYSLNKHENLFMYGYFQSERFFEKYKADIKKLFCLREELDNSDYPYLDDFVNRNSVCISIKVEHNMGSSIYDVCGDEYYKTAIDYIRQNVKAPLFFLCSDNVEKAQEMFFNGFAGDIVCQPADYPVSLSLCAMSMCKHFVINNTSFGWWAQYLSENNDKIVVAPSKWKLNNDPVNIYDNMNSWHLI